VKPRVLGLVIAALAAAHLLCALSGAAETGPVKLLLAIYGEESGEFSYPAAVSCGERLTVADTGNRRLLFFDPQGDQFRYGGQFDAGGKLGVPFCVAEVSGGRLLVAERGKPALTLCDPVAGTATPAALEGVPQAARLLPGRFCIGPEGRLFLIDDALPRIIVLSADLRFEREITVQDEGFSGFSDVRVDRQGNLYALETLRGLVHVFDPSLRRLRSFGSRKGDRAPFDFPVSLALDRQGNVYVLDSHRAQVLVFDPEGRLQWRLGSFGWKEGAFNGPSYIAVDGQNRIFVADRLNNRIQVFAPLRPM
jgi:tripartite motif-containing protein 71